jgi:hypothetical protein
MTLVMILLVFMFSSLGSIAWTERNAESKLTSIQNTRIIENGLDWTVRHQSEQTCLTGSSACKDFLSDQPVVFSGQQVETYQWENKEIKDATRWFLMTTELDSKKWEGLGSEKILVLALPRFTYQDLWVYFDGQLVRHFLEGETLGIPFQEHDGRSKIKVELVLSQPHGAQNILSLSRKNEMTFLGTRLSYDTFQQHLAVKESASGHKLRSLARIVLAVFCIFLFVFVDSSPESMALATFMGFKAVGVGIAQGWVSEWVPLEYRGPLASWVLCYADFMQLYFFAQLARLVRPNVWPWLLGGFAVATFYLIPQMVDLNEVFGSFGILWGKHFWALRSGGLGIACWIFAGLAIVAVAPQKLYWRLSALIVASLGVLVQVVTPIVSYFPDIYNTDLFLSTYYILETHTPYVFALSTFINISTLEARVKNLSIEVAEAREIEKEMALGQTVQKAFMKIPELPDHYGFDHFSEAAVYVSGDIFFVNWDEHRSTLTVVLNDVTGHGVQAALKASICTAIAESIWNYHQIRDSDQVESKLEIYDKRLHSFLNKMNQQSEDEVVSIVGLEFNEKLGKIRMYRVHGVFPIIIQRRPDRSGYDIAVEALRNRELVEMDWPEDSFVLLLSDGLVETSRTMKHLHTFLEAKLGKDKEELDESILKEVFFQFDGFEKVADDKTVLILHRRRVLQLDVPRVA